MRNTLKSLLAGALLLCPLMVPAAPTALSSNVMWTHQRADQAAVVEESTLSADLFLQGTLQAIGWTIHLEANTTPDTRGPSALGAQAAAGVATDAQDKGRVQLSEAFASGPFLGGTLHGGLIDLTGFADTSEVANDETLQFLHNDLTNNATIAFPDYDLALAWSSPYLTLMVGKDAGLADSNGNYHRLFALSAHRSGAFALAEIHVNGPLPAPIHLGVWKRDRMADEKASRGVYLDTDQPWGTTRWNLRLGWADDTAQDAARFISLAGEKSWQRWTLGVGHAATLGSGPRHAPDRHVSEGYLRYAVDHHVELSSDVQYLSERRNTWIYGVRALWRF